LAGKSAAEAVNNFIGPLQTALACVTQDVLQVAGGYHISATPHAVTLSRGQAVPLRGETGVHLRLTQQYRVVEDPDLGERAPFKCSTAAYHYALEDPEERELLAFHWHPQGRSSVTWPHIHIGEAAELGWDGLQGAHVPSGRISIEEVLRFAIAELGVEALRPDWPEVLETTQGQYEIWRTWGGSSPPRAS
jgi:hypothetical protein